MSNDNLEPIDAELRPSNSEMLHLTELPPTVLEDSPHTLATLHYPPVHPTIVGIFDSPDEAQSAFRDLRAASGTPGEVSILLAEADLHTNSPELATSDVPGGAAAGAGLGGLLGALLGWMSAIGALAIPGVGASTNAGQLSSMIGGALLGAAVGGIIGALTSMGAPAHRTDAADLRTYLQQGRILIAVHPSGIPEAEARKILNANGADSVELYNDISKSYELESGRPPILIEAQNSSFSLLPSQNEETKLMDEQDKGRNLNNVTGTEGAIDPVTGAFGTAGTPLTTGYGVSGATIGTGSVADQNDRERGDFLGSTPDQKSYEMGGRSSDDALDTKDGEPGRISVTDVYNASLSGQADVHQEPEERDLYQRGPSYGPDTEVLSNTDVTDQYSGSAVEENPSYAALSNEQSQASAGTDIPGTSNPRGLGDNTDDPDLPD